MPEKLETLEKVYISQLKDIYSAENQLINALPKMAKAATHERLRAAFTDHLEETRGHVGRLEEIFEDLGKNPAGKSCKAMEGLVAEGEEIIEEDGDPAALDAALICAAQKVEHYEIATYGTLREYARILGHEQAQRLLTATLEEERGADTKLTELAEQSINQQAMQTR